MARPPANPPTKSTQHRIGDGTELDLNSARLLAGADRRRRERRLLLLRAVQPEEGPRGAAGAVHLGVRGRLRGEIGAHLLDVRKRDPHVGPMSGKAGELGPSLGWTPPDIWMGRPNFGRGEQNMASSTAFRVASTIDEVGEQEWHGVGKFTPVLAHGWPNSATCWPKAAKSWPNAAHIDRRLAQIGQLWSAQSRPKLANFGEPLSFFSQTLSKLTRC